MLYYRINNNYALRSYENENYLIRWGWNQQKRLQQEEFELLMRCDGDTPINEEELSEEQREHLNFYVRHGQLSKLEKPMPMLEGRRYRQFDHKRRIGAIWTITARCNLDCIHCLYGFMHDSDHEMSIEDCRIVAKRLAEYGIERVCIFGGEPMVHPHFFEIYDMIYAYGMVVDTIDTNGFFLNEETFAKLKKFEDIHLPMLSVSFDGLGTHDWLRNYKGAEETALNAIRLACEQGFNVQASINVNKKTWPRMVETSKYLLGLGVRTLRFMLTYATPKWMEYEAKEGNLLYADDDFPRLCLTLTENLIKEVRQGKRLEFNTVIFIDQNTTGDQLRVEKKKPPEECGVWCNVGTYGIYVATTGDVLMCKGMEFMAAMSGFLSPDYNIIQHSLSEILDHPVYKEYFGFTRDKILENSRECRECTDWKRCYGGVCRASSMQLHGFRVAPETICNRDGMLCGFLKSGTLDKIAKILDENP